MVSCHGRFLVAEEKTAMEADDRRASVGGYGCGGEGGGGGRFVSWLQAEIQPLKEGMWMVVMVRWVGKISDE